MSIFAADTLDPLFKPPASANTGREFVRVYRLIHDGPLYLNAEEISGGDWFAAAGDAWISQGGAELTRSFQVIWTRVDARRVARIQPHGMPRPLPPIIPDSAMLHPGYSLNTVRGHRGSRSGAKSPDFCPRPDTLTRDSPPERCGRQTPASRPEGRAPPLTCWVGTVPLRRLDAAGARIPARSKPC